MEFDVIVVVAGTVGGQSRMSCPGEVYMSVELGRLIVQMQRQGLPER